MGSLATLLKHRFVSLFRSRSSANTTRVTPSRRQDIIPQSLNADFIELTNVARSTTDDWTQLELGLPRRQERRNP